MKFIRQFLAIFALAAACIALAPPAKAQSTTVALDLSGIGTIAGATTQTCTNLIMDVPRYANVALQARFNFASATTSNVVYTISRSIDRATWSTAEPFVWTIAGNGTTAVVGVTNIVVGATPFLKLETIQNTHASVVLTNTSFRYSTKKEY